MKSLKTIMFTVIILLGTFGVKAQVNSNIQMHYNKGSFARHATLSDGTPFEQEISRDDARIRLQMLGKDSLGTYYWSAEMFYSSVGKDHINTSSSLQILRGLRLSKKSYAEVIVGFNGSTNGGSNFYFAGLFHPLKFGKVVFLPLILYSYKNGDDKANFRFTSGYNTRLFNNRISIFGFFNAWTRDLFRETPFEKSGGGFQLNPQIYYNVFNKIGVGTELDMSYHRYTPDNTFVFLPSLSARWTF